MHSTLMLRGWTDDVVALTDGRSGLSPDDQRALRSAGVMIDDRQIVELVSEEDQLTAIAFADGTQLERDGLLVEALLRQRLPLAEQLGAASTPAGLATGAVSVDEFYRTQGGGVFAAGDVCTDEPHLAGAIQAGSQAAMIVVQSLLADEFGLPYRPT